jgi:hypothetical protein
MSIRNACLAAAIAAAAVVPATANEAGYIEPAPQFGVKVGKAQLASAAERRIAQPGDVSVDGRYVYLGAEPGWSARPHDMLWQNGEFVHGDTCVHAAAKPSMTRSPAELKLYRDTQIGG